MCVVGFRSEAQTIIEWGKGGGRGSALDVESDEDVGGVGSERLGRDRPADVHERVQKISYKTVSPALSREGRTHLDQECSSRGT